MRQTLFYIPDQIGGAPLFGIGALLVIWALASGVFLAWQLRLHGWTEVKGFLPVLALIGVAIAFFLPEIVVPGYGLPIRGYGVMMLVAVVCSVWLASELAERAGIHRDTILSLAFWLFLGGIIGARLFYVIEYWPEMRQHPSLLSLLRSVLNFAQGGLVVFGGLIGASCSFLVFVYRHGLPVLRMADVIAPSLALGQGIGRIGCFLSGCCYGGPTDLSWAVEFPWGTAPHVRQIENGQNFLHGIRFRTPGRQSEEQSAPIVSAVAKGSPAANAGLKSGDSVLEINGQPVEAIGHAELVLLGVQSPTDRITVLVSGQSHPIGWQVPSGSLHSRPVHPTQIYSAIDALLLCAFLLAYYPFRRRDGEVIAWLLTIHPITRGLLEIIRADEAQVFRTGLTISQVVGFGIFLLGAALWLYLWKQPLRMNSKIAEPASTIVSRSGATR